MRIVLIGANGNVGRELALRLAARPEIQLVAVSRTRGGSALLRFRGVPCAHADMTDAADAGQVLKNADVIANLALPHGDPARARLSGRRLTDSILRHAPAKAVCVFFSTLSVHGQYDPQLQRMRQTLYGRSKRAAEKHFLARANEFRKHGFVIRLGQVIGELQPLSQMIRGDLAKGSVACVDEGRASNAVHVATIAEALCLLGENPAHGPATYELVNSPNWTWRELCAFEAEQTNVDLSTITIRSVGDPGKFRPRTSMSRAMIGAALRSNLVVTNAPRVLEVLPQRFEEKARVFYLRQFVRNSLAPATTSSPSPNPASFWPPFLGRLPNGLGLTAPLVHKWPMLQGAQPWPPDIEF